MKVSGFSMVKNATKLYFPIKESIESVLPLCDEFIVAVGDCDEDDRTLEEIKSIGSEKIKIINTVWDIDNFKRGSELARQTNFAKKHCSGDWLIYIQADEVLHEEDYDVIKDAMEKNLANDKVEGFVFKYKHFWGDFEHYHTSHGWYKHEIRIIRNKEDIYSWRDAQSFRRIPNYTDEMLFNNEETIKLNVKKIDAYVYHYGWARPPHLMKNKINEFETIFGNHKKVNNLITDLDFDFGPLNKISKYVGSHPKLMDNWIKKFDWGDKLYYDGELRVNRRLFKHERWKYKVVTFFEKYFFGGKELFGFKNYNEV